KILHYIDHWQHISSMWIHDELVIDFVVFQNGRFVFQFRDEQCFLICYMSREDVAREENLVFLKISDHGFLCMKKWCFVETYRFSTKVYFISRSDNHESFLVQLVHFHKFVYSKRCADNLCILRFSC